MKKTIITGAYGWTFQHWMGSFYPEDLPEEWQLSYYSNEFPVVMIPAGYWRNAQTIDCAQWLDDVHEKFHFYVECQAAMLNSVSMDNLKQQLKPLKSQISALVLIHDETVPIVPENNSVRQDFALLAQALQVDLLEPIADDSGQWQLYVSGRQAGAKLVVYNSDVSDLRVARKMVQAFSEQIPDQISAQMPDHVLESCIIIKQSQLKAEKLSDFRDLLEIMGH